VRPVRPPEHIRRDNDSEFTAKCVREWLGRVGVKTLFIEPVLAMGERVCRELQRKAPRRAAGTRSLCFDTLFEANVLIERWRQDSNTIRPHSASGVPTPGPPDAASALGWSVGGPEPSLKNLSTGIIHGGRSPIRQVPSPTISGQRLNRVALPRMPPRVAVFLRRSQRSLLLSECRRPNGHATHTPPMHSVFLRLPARRSAN